ncbi:hypothetical protein OB931_09370 [Aeromonas media]|uniref:hypothetical protein n=1 Tax=Aeromonas media TaxID=651 RepID=UPI0024C1535A|nr:hypothetical protein [Aeromonas media]MDM5076583.1 hypothetical protein [Aeromonas media]
MNSDIFLDDFEITENTQELHAILGRCLIVATHFDHLCDHTSKSFELKHSYVKAEVDLQKFEDYAIELMYKYQPLHQSIESLSVNGDVKNILIAAKKARNEIAHSLAIGLTGCLDTKIDESKFKSHLTQLIQDVAAGDHFISSILSLDNNAPLFQFSHNKYQEKIVAWVLGK